MGELISEQDNSILNLLPVGVGIADMQGNLLFFNNEMLVPGGYSREDMKAITNVSNLYFDPQTRAKVLDLAKSQGYVDRYEVEFKKKDGTPYATYLSLRLVRYNSAPAWLAIVQDITREKSLEVLGEKYTSDLEQTKLAMMNLLDDLDAEKVQLERERKRDEALLVSIGDGVVVTDEQGRITFVNKAFEDLIGWNLTEVTGKMMVDVVPKYDENDQLIVGSERSVSKVLSGEVKRGSISTMNRSHYYKKRDGSKLPIIGVVTPIVVEERIVGAVQVFHDITLEKEMDRIKDEFLSLASHELRTPLTAIDGLVSMIKDGEYGEVSPGLIRPLEDVSISSERLIRLVNDLLSLSRMQAGRLRYILSVFSVSDIVNKVVGLLTPLFDEKGLSLKFTPGHQALVFADRDKVEQVLENIIGNSLKFTDHGEVGVDISDNPEFVKVSIRDTGIGIIKEDQEKLFGRFQQLESGNDRPQGTGLGLHISRQMIRKMGGELLLEHSEPGMGSTFSFTLPKAGSQTASEVKEAIGTEAKMHPDQKSDIIEK